MAENFTETKNDFSNIINPYTNKPVQTGKSISFNQKIYNDTNPLQARYNSLDDYRNRMSSPSVNQKALYDIPVVPEVMQEEYNDAYSGANWLNSLNIASPEEIDEWRAKGKMGLAETAQRLASLKSAKYAPFVGTTAEVGYNLDMLSAVNRLKKGQQISELEQDLLVDYLRELKEIQVRGTTLPSKVLSGILESIPYFVEFGVGVAAAPETFAGSLSLSALALSKAAGKKAARKAVEKALKNAATESVMTGTKKNMSLSAAKSLYKSTYNEMLKAGSTKAVKEVGGKEAAKIIAKTTPQSIVAANFGSKPLTYMTAKNTIGGFADRQLAGSMQVTDAGELVFKEPENMALSIMKSFGSAIFDNYTETMGWAFAPVSSYFAKPIRNVLPKKFFTEFEKLVSSRYGMKATDALKKYGYDGVVEEMGEELLNRFLCDVFGIQGLEGYTFDGFMNNVFYANDPEQWLVEAMSFALMGGAAHGVHGSYSKIREELEKQGNEKALQRLTELANKRIYSPAEFYLEQGLIKINGSQSAAEQMLREKFTENGIDKATADDYFSTASELQIREKLKEFINEETQDAGKRREKAVEFLTGKMLENRGYKDKDLAAKNANLVVTALEKFSETEGVSIDELIRDEAPTILTQEDAPEVEEKRIIDNRLAEIEQEFENLSEADFQQGGKFEQLEAEYGELVNRKNQGEVYYQEANTAGAEDGEYLDAAKEWKEKGTDSQYFKRWFGDSKVVDEDGKPLVVYHGTPDIIEQFDSRYAGDTTGNNDYGAFFFCNDKEIAEDYSRQAFIRRYEGRDKEELQEYYKEQFNLSDEQIDGIIEDLDEEAEKQIKTVDVYLKMENPIVINNNYNVTPVSDIQELIGWAKEGRYSDIVEKYVDVYGTQEYDADDIEDYREEIEVRARENYGLEEDEEIEDYMFNEAASEVLDENGIYPEEKQYDGIIIRNTVDDISNRSSGIQDTYIVFNPEQIKSVDNRGAFDENNPNIYYQEEIDDKNLMIHATRSEKIDDILSSGSLVAPSMAVVKKGEKSFNFGDVIFVRNPKRIDYQNDNIYDRDIYSPRLPQADYLTEDGEFVSAYDYSSMERLSKSDPERFKRLYSSESFEEYFKGAKKVINMGFTPSGNRKTIPYNAQNLINYIKKESLKAGENWDYGLSSLLAKLAEKQENKEKLKSTAKENLDISNPELSEKWNTIKKEYEEFEDKLRPYYINEYEYIFETIGDIFYAVEKNNNRKLSEYIDTKALPKSLIKEMKDFIKKVKKIPRAYFEAKPMREVSLSEFSVALAPKGELTKTQKQQLKDYGIEVKEYKEGELGKEIDKLQDRQDVYFQDENDYQGNMFYDNLKARDLQKVKGSFIPAENLIELFKNADESTIVHEFAHWWLDKLVKYSQKNEELAADVEAIRKFVKNEGEPFTREQHEKFARGFEAYIRSGYAKNNRLKRIFEDFKNALLAIYDSIKQLGFKDDDMPQIQGLFDRLLTTEKERIRATVFDKIAEIDAKIEQIKDNEAKELAELDELYKDNINLLNRKSDKQRKAEEYVELAEKMTSRETKEVKDFKKRYKEATLDILSTISGKPRSWVANSRNWEKLQDMVGNADDKLTTSGGLKAEWQDFYADTGISYDNDEIDGDYKLGEQAFNVMVDGRYNRTFDADYRFEDIDKYISKLDYLAAKVKTLKGTEKEAAFEAFCMVFGNMPEMPDEIMATLASRVPELESEYEEQQKNDFNKKHYPNIPIVQQLQFYITNKLNELKVYNPETRYKMRLNRSHRLYRYIKDITSVDAAKKQIRRINDFIIDDMRNNQRSLLHKEIQKQIHVNSKTVKVGTLTKGKFDWKTNTVFSELVQMNKMSREDAEAQLGNLVQIQDAAKSEDRESYDENETGEFNKTNDFQDNLKKKFLQYRSMRLQDLDVTHTIQLLQDILELKEKGRQAKSEEDFINKTQRWNTKNNLLDILEVTKASGAKFGANWVTGVGRVVSLNGGTLANWESLLNAIFNKDTARKYSLLQDEAQSEIYARKHMKYFYDRAAQIYGFKQANNWDRFLDFDYMQPMIKLFQEYADEKYTYTQSVFSINSPEGIAKSNIEISRAQMITMFAWSLNEKLEQRLFTQFGLNQIRDMFENVLSKEDKELAWALVDTCERMREDINEVFIRTTGLSLPAVENYFPSKAERVQSDIDMYHDFFVKSSSPSFIKERKTCNRIPMKPLAPLEILIPHINKTAKYVVMSEKVNFLNQVFKDTAIKTKMQEIWGSKDGADIYQTLINKLAASTFSNYSKGTNLVAGALDTLSRNYITSSIGFSPKVALGQLLSVINYAENMPAHIWAKGFKDVLKHPVETFKYMLENCEYLQTRLAGNSQNEVMAILTSEKDKFRTLRNFMTSNVKWGDIIAITLGGKPYVDYLMQQGMSKEDAFNKFVEDTMRAQQAGTTSSISEWQSAQAKNCLSRMFFAFRNTDMQYERKFVDTLIQAKKGEIGKKEAIKKLFIYKIFNPFMFTSFLQNLSLVALFRALFDDDTDEAITGFLKSAVEAVMLSGMTAYGLAGFVAKSIMESIVAHVDKEYKHFETDVPVLNDINMQANKILKGDLEFADYVEALATGSEFALGIPSTKVVNTLGGVGDVAQGNVGVGLSRMAGWGRYTSTKAWTGEEPEKRRKRRK